jgi:hypothetical protein
MSESAPTLAAKYTRDEAEMNRLHDGEALRIAAEYVLAQLPAGPLFLISTSAQGAALAAVCAVTRRAPTRWQFVNALLDPVAASGRVVVVEPIDGGAGWREALLRRYPDADFVFAANSLALAA